MSCVNILKFGIIIGSDDTIKGDVVIVADIVAEAIELELGDCCDYVKGNFTAKKNTGRVKIK